MMQIPSPYVLNEYIIPYSSRHYIFSFLIFILLHCRLSAPQCSLTTHFHVPTLLMRFYQIICLVRIVSRAYGLYSHWLVLFKIIAIECLRRVRIVTVNTNGDLSRIEWGIQGRRDILTTAVVWRGGGGGGVRLVRRTRRDSPDKKQ